MKLLKKSSIFLLMFMVVMLIFSTLLFFINISISRLHLVLSFFITIIIYFFMNRKIDKQDFIKIISLWFHYEKI